MYQAVRSRARKEKNPIFVSQKIKIQDKENIIDLN